MNLRNALPSAILAGLAVFALILASCSTVPYGAVTPPQIEGASFVGNKACVDCHAEFTRQFPSSPHARLHVEGAPHSDSAGCESCHGPGSLHVKAGGGRKLIVNPGRDAQACFACHVEIHAQFKLPQHHPVLEGRMNCVQCHDPHGGDIMKASHRTALGVRAATGMARLNESCGECHREQARPMIYHHEALREGCIICHQPHGSIAYKMLVQRDNNLCLKCHAQVPTLGGQIYIGDVPHTTFVNRGACWSAGCHTAVHGSNVDRKLRQ
ncbi:MAG TPA: cytochrome c3 family protein [Candidatus Binatia bacterium]|nr:cytochrome c3 family protein [Candidatus Binatia bacterium]